MFCAQLSSQLLLQCQPPTLELRNDIKNFESYPWGIDVFKELLRELGGYKGTLLAIREAMAMSAREAKLELVVLHIPTI